MTLFGGDFIQHQNLLFVRRPVERLPAGIFTRWIWGTSAKRVVISISRRSGFQLARLAPRKLLYRSTLVAREAGIDGTPSATRFSFGETVSFCAKAEAPISAIKTGREKRS